MSALVDLRDVFVVHPSEDGGVAALRGLTLGVERGEICVVLGPSGAGKSTLVRVVAGLERPSAGLALVDGLDVGAASASAVARHRARVVGYADQHYWRALSGDLTAQELVGLPLGLRGAPRDRPGPSGARAARARRPARPGDGPTAGALRRRAAAHRALRRGRALARAARRRRADRRARRDDCRGRARSPCRPRTRRGRRRARREPRPDVRGDRRPRRARPRRPDRRGAPRRGRHGRDRPRRLAARAGGDLRAAGIGERAAVAARPRRRRAPPGRRGRSSSPTPATPRRPPPARSSRRAA